LDYQVNIPQKIKSIQDSGVSMGGHMASLAITNVQDHQTVVVPCLSWTSAAPVYTLGALSTAIPWEVLQNELDKNDSLKNTINSCGWIEAMVYMHYFFFRSV
jgi:hypothetical protein